MRDLHHWLRKFRAAKDKHERLDVADEFHTWLTEYDELTMSEALTLLHALNQKGYVS